MISTNGNNSAQHSNKIVSQFTAMILCLIFCFFANPVQASDGDTTPAGTVITNRADATYQDTEGNDYSTVSQTITITVAAVPSVNVTPDETAPSSPITPNQSGVKLFQVCNTGNVTDFYSITRVEASSPVTITGINFDTDNSGTLTNNDTPATLNQTLTPRIAPQNCYGVLVSFASNQVAPQTQIAFNLTAQSTLALSNGTYPSDTGTIINVAGTGARLTAPNDANLPPLMLIESNPRAVAAAGQTLNYTISFANSGDLPAQNVRVVDELPAELEIIPETLFLNDRLLTDATDNDEGTTTARRFEILINQIAPETTVRIKFQARLTAAAAISGTGIVNTASVSAQNFPAVNTSTAIAIANPVGTIYAGQSAGAAKISGAQITVATDRSGTALALSPNTGFSPNPENKSVFTSDANGGFSFALNEAQFGSTANPARYYITVAAPNYRPRVLEVTITPAANGLFTATIRSLDNQPLASANSFALTNEAVSLDKLAAMVFNIPLFELSTLEISKNADKQLAQIGDIVTYRIQVRNATASPMREIAVRDTLPPSFVYADNTAQIETSGATRSVNPEVNGSDLAFSLGDLTGGASATISYRVKIGANAREGEQFNIAVASGSRPNGERLTTEAARAAVRIRAGMFGTQQIVIGRVFEDANGNGMFDSGERPVAGARVYLNNGQSVITDSAGQYNLPSVNGGSLVLSLDPTTVPQNYNLLNDDGRRSSTSWTRLLRTPLGGGSLLRQNFAVAPKAPEFAISGEVKVIAANGGYVPDTIKTVNAESIAAQKTENAAQIVVKENRAAAEKNKIVKEKSDNSETYTIDSTEDIAAVAPGEVKVITPEENAVIMSPALNLTARVAENWTIEAEVNGEKIPSANIGESRVDHRNKITTVSFVGMSIRPGSNQIRLTPIDPNGVRGKSKDVIFWGRGAATRVEVVPAKKEIQAGGKETVAVEIKAYDQWGHPALDSQVAVETSAGRFLTNNALLPSDSQKSSTIKVAQINDVEPNQSTPALNSTAVQRQQVVSLKDGVATIQLIAEASAAVANLKAVTGNQESRSQVRFTPEMRPTLMVGIGEVSIGRAAPEIAASGDDTNFRSRVAFYYRGGLFKTDNLLTLAYDSNRALNRVAGRDRFGELDPLDRTYPVFGDSSLRFDDALSNSKLYARVDRRRSYAMFGDMESDMNDLTLAGYGRKLTGGKIHLENGKGDFVSVTGARPDTAFARDVIPGGTLSLSRLSHTDILTGSEVVALEIRDRRNPEVVLKREQFIRSVDYNLNTLTGEIFFLRPIQTFDNLLNLVQIVVTYEYRGAGASNYVYTGRASQQIERLGLRVGASYVNQQQGEVGAFQLGGIDFEKRMPGNGRLNFEMAASRGRFAASAGVFDYASGGFTEVSEASRERNGTAFKLTLDQPLPFFQSRLKSEFSRSSENFYNPFGATITPGAQRAAFAFEMRPASRRGFSFGFIDERNKTSNVDNSRQTLSFLWSEQWRDNLRTVLGFDRRFFTDNLTDKSIGSNLVTAGIEYRPIEKLELSVKREQNLSDSDPTYPTQTTLAADYELNTNAKLFFTQRLAAAPITPISDLSDTGFSALGSRRETAIGIESKIGRLGALNGRYQLENGISGTDSFAVIGLQNRLPLNKTVALEAGFERGFLLTGNGTSFNNANVGASYTPDEDFRATARYELRNRNGFAQLFSLGAAGCFGNNWTALARGQMTRGSFNGRSASSDNMTLATAYRPLDSDRYALLFSLNSRSMSQEGALVNNVRQALIRDRTTTLSTDGLWQPKRNTEVYGRFAFRFNGNGDGANSYASALTYIAQGRIQQRLTNYFDVAGEARWLAQRGSRTSRQSFGAELGFWLMPDLRLGGGYNFTRAMDLTNLNLSGTGNNFRSGFYFTVTSKFSNLFDLLGTSKKGLANETEETPDPNRKDPIAKDKSPNQPEEEK